MGEMEGRLAFLDEIGDKTGPGHATMAGKEFLSVQLEMAIHDIRRKLARCENDVVGIHRLAIVIDGRTDDGLENATGTSENGSATCGLAKGIVELAILKGIEVDSLFGDKGAEILGRPTVVNVENAIGLVVRKGVLVFLEDAGDDGHDDNILRLDLDGIGKVGLGDRAQTADRGLDCRDQSLLEEIAEHPVGKGQPSDAAGVELGIGAVVLDPVIELLGLFPNGDIGAKVGIEDITETDLAEGGDHLAGHLLANLPAEHLAQGDTDGRGGLDDDDLFRILEKLLDLTDFHLLHRLCLCVFHR